MGCIKHIGYIKLVIISMDNKKYTIMFDWITGFELNCRCKASRYMYGV